MDAIINAINNMNPCANRLVRFVRMRTFQMKSVKVALSPPIIRNRKRSPMMNPMMNPVNTNTTAIRTQNKAKTISKIVNRIPWMKHFDRNEPSESCPCDSSISSRLLPFYVQL